MPKHKPKAFTGLFGGIGVERVADLLTASASGVRLLNPQGCVVCSKGRSCYRDLGEDLLAANAYQKKWSRRRPVSEGLMLATAFGDGLLADRRVVTVESEV